MDKCIILRYISLIIGLSLICTGLSAAADKQPTSLINERPHAIYHVIKNKTLREAATQLANRSGISFQINAAIEQDLINRKLAADDWNTALSQLLQGYNFTTVVDQQGVVSVLVSGLNHNAADTALGTIIKPQTSSALPSRFQHLKAGSVMPLSLPIAALRQMKTGDTINLDLPIGQYQIKHDQRVEHEDGNVSWLGYLDDEGKGYRLLLSMGNTGLMGTLYTPGGEYNLETVDGESFLIDITASGLQSAGFQQDIVTPPSTPQVSMAAKVSDSIETLKTKAELARAIADALNLEAQNLNTQYQQATNNASTLQLAVTTAKTSLADAKTNLALAKQQLKSAPKETSLLTALAAAKLAVTTAKSAVATAEKNYSAAKKSAKSLYSAYTKKLAAYNKAEAAAQKAEAAYTTAKAKAVSAVQSSSNNVLDVMVLYTTASQTASYAKQRIQFLIDASNQAYKDSGVDASLRLVYAGPSRYTETNSNEQALDDFASDSNVAALRDRYGADIVVFLRPLYVNTSGNCGIAYQGFLQGSGSYSELAYAVVSDGSSKEPDTSSYCTTGTFAHEIGHVQGNVHDREFSSSAGKFSYSYAWGINDRFGTIMSYYSPLVMLFSTPNLPTECAGTPCGFAAGTENASDQVSTINYTAPLVAKFRSTAVSTAVIE